MREFFFVIFYCQSVRIAYNEKYKPKIYLIVVPHELFVRDFLFAERKCTMYGLSEESLTIVGVILIVVGVAMIGWGFEWNQDITNDKRVGTVVRDIGVMVLATGIIFVMQRAMN